MDKEQLIRATLDPELRAGIETDQVRLRTLLGAPDLGEVEHIASITAPESVAYGVSMAPTFVSNKLHHKVRIRQIPHVMHEGSVRSWAHDVSAARVNAAVVLVKAADGEDLHDALLRLVRALTRS